MEGEGVSIAKFVPIIKCEIHTNKVFFILIIIIMIYIYIYIYIYMCDTTRRKGTPRGIR